MENASQNYIEPINNTVIEQAFKNYYKALVQYGFTILKDRDEAEDTVQQVFTILVQKMESIEIETNLRAYLYKAVYHQSLNKLEYQKRRPNMDISLMAENQNMTIETSFHDDLALKIEKEIDALPAQCSKIFRMSRYQDLKYQEIANELQLSVKTIENQMGKALKILRENLKEYLIMIFIIINNIN